MIEEPPKDDDRVVNIEDYAGKRRPTEFRRRHNGLSYSARYLFEDGMVTVTTTKNSQSALAEEGTVDMIAHRLLREMIEGGTADPD
jgi:hypothetical protein